MSAAMLAHYEDPWDHGRMPRSVMPQAEVRQYLLTALAKLGPGHHFATRIVEKTGLSRYRAFRELHAMVDEGLVIAVEVPRAQKRRGNRIHGAFRLP